MTAVIGLALLDIFGKKDVSDELRKRNPYGIKVSFHPYRLTANKSDTIRANIKVENFSSEPLLTSVVVQVPKALGLDPTCLSQTREIRLGELGKGESRDIPADIFGNIKTDEGSYTVTITAIAHYRNYAYVLNSEKKTVSVRVV